jgi:hypothetical protein
MPQSIPPGLTREHVLRALSDLDAGVEHPSARPGTNSSTRASVIRPRPLSHWPAATSRGASDCPTSSGAARPPAKRTSCCRSWASPSSGRARPPGRRRFCAAAVHAAQLCTTQWPAVSTEEKIEACGEGHPLVQGDAAGTGQVGKHLATGSRTESFPSSVRRKTRRRRAVW